MGYINKDELSNELLEYMEGLGLTEEQVNQIINTLREEELGNVGNLQTEAKDLVGAINELFQSANNGKELIANAIGEPLNSEDTFSAMSNDINGLLSTFKTNMMNNGVTVESGDKFKQLIDKIATMLEEGSGKGIQYAEGSATIPIKITSFTTIRTNLNFTPTIIFAKLNYFNINDTSVYSNYVIGNFNQTTTSGYSGAYIPNDSITSTSFNIYLTTYTSGYGYISSGTTVDWYAIGVGEEDTTLLDSLKSILAEEGVTTTEEDDMASLISKVDEEFDNKNTLLTEKDNSITNLQKEINGMAKLDATASGNTITLYTYEEERSNTATDWRYWAVHSETVPAGKHKVQFDIKVSFTGTTTSGTGYFKVVSADTSGRELYAVEFSTTSTSATTKSCYIDCVQGGSVMVCYKTSASSTYARISNLYITTRIAV